ncbi:MAG: response regulator [Candidatus Obscuribacterales bacterium]|nr:response regulator [Candidatus Obscuribacterales bacterium]
MKEQAVLIVEDSLAQQQVIELIVKELGFLTHSVTTGQQAVEAVKAVQFAAILMDIGLPDIDGFECAWRIRQSEAQFAWHVPIIAVTASESDENFQMRYRTCGIDGYLRKPFLPAALHELLVRYTDPPRPQKLPAGSSQSRYNNRASAESQSGETIY